MATRVVPVVAAAQAQLEGLEREEAPPPVVVQGLVHRPPWKTCAQAHECCRIILHFLLGPLRIYLGLLELQVQALESLAPPFTNLFVFVLLGVFGIVFNLLLGLIDSICIVFQPYHRRQAWYDKVEDDGRHTNSIYASQTSLAFLCRFGTVGANLGITVLGCVPCGATERKGEGDVWRSQIRLGGQSAIGRAFARGIGGSLTASTETTTVATAELSFVTPSTA